DEIYRELLPRLVTLARECGLDLVFKLHPFESAAGHKRILGRFLDRNVVRKIRIVSGPISAKLWRRTACAMTVQSTVAVECSTRGIPTFMCGWLADPSCGYAEQFQRFGNGRVLHSVAEFDQVRSWINYRDSAGSQMRQSEFLDPSALRRLLTGTHSRPAL